MFDAPLILTHLLITILPFLCPLINGNNKSCSTASGREWVSCNKSKLKRAVRFCVCLTNSTLKTPKSGNERESGHTNLCDGCLLCQLVKGLADGAAAAGDQIADLLSNDAKTESTPVFQEHWRWGCPLSAKNSLLPFFSFAIYRMCPISSVCVCVQTSSAFVYDWNACLCYTLVTFARCQKSYGSDGSDGSASPIQKRSFLLI